MPRRKTTEEFTSRSRKVHGEKYDYSQVEIEHANSIVKIRCPEHGIFIQNARSHYIGFGCPSCSGMKKKTTRLR